MNIFSRYFSIALLFLLAGPSFAASIDLDLISFTGPAINGHPDATWKVKTDTHFYFEDLELTGNDLTGGKLIYDKFWTEAYDDDQYLSGFIEQGEYYLDSCLRDYNVYSATFDEDRNLYSVTVASMFGYLNSPYLRPMTFELTPSPVPLPPALLLFASGLFALFAKQNISRINRAATLRNS